MDDRQLKLIREIGKFYGRPKFEKFYKVGSRNGCSVYIREFSARSMSDDSMRRIITAHRPSVEHKITERDRQIARLQLSVPKPSITWSLLGLIMLIASIAYIAFITRGP